MFFNKKVFKVVKEETSDIEGLKKTIFIGSFRTKKDAQKTMLSNFFDYCKKHGNNIHECIENSSSWGISSDCCWLKGKNTKACWEILECNTLGGIKIL